MTPNQMTRKMSREIAQFYRVLLHVQDVCVRRGTRDIDDGDQAERDIRGQYQVMTFYVNLAIERLERMWTKLELWADTNPAPQRFDVPLAGRNRIRLRRMLSTVNILTDAQVDGYTVVDEEWTGPGQGLNRFERLFEVLDAFADLATIFGQRLEWWEDEWELQGSARRERQVMAILREERDATGVLRSVLADITIDIRGQKGETETSVPELRVRNRFLKRRATIQGGIQAINRGVTTVELGGTVEPDEYIPDIETVRDEPDLGTDVV